MSRRTIGTDEVCRIAHLARLTLSPGEAERLAAELGEILDYVSRIAELEPQLGAAREDPAPHAGSPVLRADEPHACLDQEDVARAASRFERGHFVVPRVVDRD